MGSAIYFFSRSCVYCHSSLPVVVRLGYRTIPLQIEQFQAFILGLEIGPISPSVSFPETSRGINQSQRSYGVMAHEFWPCFYSVYLLATGSRALCRSPVPSLTISTLSSQTMGWGKANVPFTLELFTMEVNVFCQQQVNRKRCWKGPGPLGSFTFFVSSRSQSSLPLCFFLPNYVYLH